MKIEIEIGEGNVGQSVQEILATLGAEERKTLAREVMMKWLANTLHSDEREVKEREVVARIQKENQSSFYNKDETPGQIRGGYKFQEAMRGWKSSRDVLVEQVGAEITLYYKDHVKSIVEGDPTLQQMREKIGKLVLEQYPKMVHDALIAWFTSHMQTVLEGAARASIQIPQIEEFQKKLIEKLGGH
jgi:hypothetical protein